VTHRGPFKAAIGDDPRKGNGVLKRTLAVDARVVRAPIAEEA